MILVGLLCPLPRQTTQQRELCPSCRSYKTRSTSNTNCQTILLKKKYLHHHQHASPVESNRFWHVEFATLPTNQYDV
uniref:Uncharacterized protein n=1 Tax=Caenorhabditis japonica TaxID=281687 RepID=A0A8R1J198_CAEJA